MTLVWAKPSEDCHIGDFKLVDADTNTPFYDITIDELENESKTTSIQLDYSIVKGQNLSLVYFKSAGCDKFANPQLRFRVSGVMTHNQTEKVAPYALFGDIDGDFNGRKFGKGAHTIEVFNQGSSVPLWTFIIHVTDYAIEGVRAVTGLEEAGNTEYGAVYNDVITFDSEIDRSLVCKVYNEEAVESVSFNLKGNSVNYSWVENVAPYALFGDIDGDFNLEYLGDAGEYELSMTAYANDNATGDHGVTKTIKIIITKEAFTPRFYLVDADTGNKDKVIGMEEHAVFFENELPNKITVLGDFKNYPVGSVQYSFIGSNADSQFMSVSQLENVAPYTVFGDSNGVFSGRSFRPGEYRLRYSAHSHADRFGILLNSGTLSFTILEGSKDTRTYIPNDIIEETLIGMGLDDIMDNYVLTQNISTLKELLVSRLPNDFRGLEDFKSLEKLSVHRFEGEGASVFKLPDNLPIKTLNLSEGLSDDGYTVFDFDFSNLRQLEKLDLYLGGLIENVELPNENLKDLKVQYYGSGTFDFNALDYPKLSKLVLEGFSSTSLDLSNHSAIKDVYIDYARNMTNLDISGTVALEKLELDRLGSLDKLDLTNTPKLNQFALNLEFTDPNTCIKVDDVDAAINNSNWVIPPGSAYSTTGDCSNNEAGKEMDITVAPNPAVTSVKVSPITLHASNIKSVEILDISGRVLKTYHNNEAQNTLDVSSLPKGIYFIRATAVDNVIQTKTLLKN